MCSREVNTAMSKANSHGKSTTNGSGNGTTSGAAGASTRHHRRPRKNSAHGGAADHDAAVEMGGGNAGDRSTVRDYAGTMMSHSQATTGARRDHQLLCPTRVAYENTYRIEPQVSLRNVTAGID